MSSVISDVWPHISPANKKLVVVVYAKSVHLNVGQVIQYQ